MGRFQVGIRRRQHSKRDIVSSLRQIGRLRPGRTELLACAEKEISYGRAGTYVVQMRLLVDDEKYGGNSSYKAKYKAEKKSMHGLPFAIAVNIPGNSITIYKPENN